MAPLGPFGAAPALAVGVSGGADSIALCLLAADWMAARGGCVRALIVDHGLRPEATGEAEAVVARLAGCGIAARVLTLTGLMPGPRLAARARAARYAALAGACREAGIVHLLVGHHAADQAETLQLRVLAGSGWKGLAGMAALRETGDVRLLRPLLGFDPDRLRATAGRWVDDPSNRNRAATRVRLRLAAVAGAASLAAAAREAGVARAAEEARDAALLARRVTLYPEGWALLTPGPLSVGALAALIATVGGAAHGPAGASLLRLAAAPRPAVLGGVALRAAGRFGPGLLVLREAARLGPAIPAIDGALWDGRFRLRGSVADAVIGAVGEAASMLRERSSLPAAILRTLPGLWRGGMLVAVPHLGYRAAAIPDDLRIWFAPARPLAGAGWRVVDDHDGDASRGRTPYLHVTR